jgi:hypothetical protein
MKQEARISVNLPVLADYCERHFLSIYQSFATKVLTQKIQFRCPVNLENWGISGILQAFRAGNFGNLGFQTSYNLQARK